MRFGWMMVAALALASCGQSSVSGADAHKIRADTNDDLIEPGPDATGALDASAGTDAAAADTSSLNEPDATTPKLDAAVPSDAAMSHDASPTLPDAGPPPDAAFTTPDAAMPPDATAFGVDASTPPDAAAVPTDAAFPIYSDSRDLFGAYVWGVDYAAYPGTPDKLNWGVQKVIGLGGHTVRVYLGPNDTYGFNSGAPFDLVTAASSAPYVALFSDPNLDTILLTTYTLEDAANDWIDGYSLAQHDREAAEIEALATHLLTNWPGKVFVILNWEGDNAVLKVVGAHPLAWAGFAAWIDARHQGVAAARSKNPSATARVLSALEFNLVRRIDLGNAACDDGGHKCVITSVAPSAPVDLYSYSSWQSLGVDTTEGDISTRLPTDLDFALGAIRAKRPGFAHSDVVLGEFGSAREIPDWGECAAARRAREAIDAARTWGVGVAIYWQVVDNVLDGSQLYTGFGLFKADGSTALAAPTFQSLYQTQVAVVPQVPLCTSINQGGVVDAVTFTSVIHPGAVISAWGNFSDTGNVVHLRQGATEVVVAAGSPTWYESKTQINATLPQAIGVGTLLVFVRSADGVDSNGQAVSITP